MRARARRRLGSGRSSPPCSSSSRSAGGARFSGAPGASASPVRGGGGEGPSAASAAIRERPRPAPDRVDFRDPGGRDGDGTGGLRSARLASLAWVASGGRSDG
ncbi:hypothetical protein SETIT_3G193700v2 [Setaria italica]|uniref:Uncharacterized protein n=2 Tax=Setaria TaxID=4554 RepID=A0A368QGT2_SETIT|nr:hypothetical protein SETIT_3G193700v2 [Setaria italica]TKW26559.1 hypothetical protein SEVIR_3G198200v2 [Setaria viridis]